jgi:hypothetical protein
MKPYIVGIGGTGGNVLSHFLRSRDIGDLKWRRLFREESDKCYVAFAGVKGLWVEAAASDVSEDLQLKNKFVTIFGDIENSYPGYLLPAKLILEKYGEAATRISSKWGFDLTKQGFYSDPVYLKAIFEAFEIDNDLSKRDNPLAKEVLKHLVKNTNLSDPSACDSIIFILSLGGGTGTGYVNPLTKSLRKLVPAYPVFVLGVLTEKGPGMDPNRPPDKRCFSAAVAICDFLSRLRGPEAISGLILVDNEILNKKCGEYDPLEWDKFIFEAMKPFVESRPYPNETHDPVNLNTEFGKGLKHPPILVPCYQKVPRASNTEKILVQKALEDGRLFDCDPKKSDRIFVFTRGLVDSDKLKKEIADQTMIPENLIEDKVYNPWCKLGDGENEILILLSNPYGGSPDAWNSEGTLEKRIYELLENGVRYLKNEHLVDQGLREDTRVSLGAYYFGKEWVKDERTKIECELKDPDLQGISREKLEKYKQSLESYLSLDFEPPFLKGELERAMRNLKRDGENEKEIFLNQVNIFAHMRQPMKKNGLDQSITKAGSKNNAEEDMELYCAEEQKIVDLVNKRVDEKLVERGVIKPQ